MSHYKLHWGVNQSYLGNTTSFPEYMSVSSAGKLAVHLANQSACYRVVSPIKPINASFLKVIIGLMCNTAHEYGCGDTYLMPGLWV